MRQGDLVILSFPYADLAQSKWRPAVVLSNERYNKHANVLLAGVYGKKQPFSVRITNNDMERRQLNKVSYVSMQNIFSADKSLIKHTVDTLTVPARGKVFAELEKCL